MNEPLRSDQWQSELQTVSHVMAFQQGEFRRADLEAALRDGQYEYRDRKGALSFPVLGLDPDDRLWGRVSIKQDVDTDYVARLELFKAVDRASFLAPTNSIPLLGYFALLAANITSNNDFQPVIVTARYLLPKQSWRAVITLPMRPPDEMRQLPGNPEITGLEFRNTDPDADLRFASIDSYPMFTKFRVSLTAAISFFPIEDLFDRTLAVTHKELLNLATQIASTDSDVTWSSTND